jgi:hypothetical protein
MFEDSDNFFAKTIIFWFVLCIIFRLQIEILMDVKLDNKFKEQFGNLSILISLGGTILILKILPLYYLIDENSVFRMLIYFLFPIVITVFSFYVPIFIKKFYLPTY